MGEIMIIRNAILVAASGLALASCSANPGPVINTSTKKLISYFEAKQELATTLQQQLGGPAARTAGNDNVYRLVALNGPAYQLGSVLSANNTLDLMTRKCAVAEGDLPIEPWSAMPQWSSNSTLNTQLGIPAPFRGVFDETSADAGLSFESASVYSIEDLSQVFLARDELDNLISGTSECGDFFSTLDEPVLFVRGIVLGRETLRSAKGFSAGLDVRVVEKESGQFSFKFDRNGAYELSDASAVPKFAVMAKLVPVPIPVAAMRPAQEVPATSDVGERQSGPILAGTSIGESEGEPSPMRRYRIVAERLSDEEIAAIEASAGKPQ